jgi:hypothetical protein
MTKQLPEPQPLTNVHDALHRAVLSERNRVNLVPATFKIDPLKKEISEQICQKNGTTLSSFLRECCEGLILDYAGPKAAAKLNSGT